MTMRQIVEENGVFVFQGAIDNPEDILSAAAIAADCPAYSIDEDDEDYCDGEKTCFNCRRRRWTREGFQCARNLLHA